MGLVGLIVICEGKIDEPPEDKGDDDDDNEDDDGLRLRLEAPMGAGELMVMCEGGSGSGRPWPADWPLGMWILVGIEFELGPINAVEGNRIVVIEPEAPASAFASGDRVDVDDDTKKRVGSSEVDDMFADGCRVPGCTLSAPGVVALGTNEMLVGGIVIVLAIGI